MRLFVLMTAALLVASCTREEQPVAPVSESGELVVLTVNGPTTFYVDADGNYAGLEYDLVARFASELGLAVRFVLVPDLSQVVSALAQHRAHLAAAGLTITQERSRAVRFGPPYQTVRYDVAFNAGNDRPRNIADLAGKRVRVMAGTGATENLRQAQQQHPGLLWREMETGDGLEILSQLAEGEVDYVVAKSDLVDMAGNFFPNVNRAFSLGAPMRVAWAFPSDGEVRLRRQAQEFFARIQRDGTLKRLMDRYYGHLQRLNTADVTGLLQKMRTVLPSLRTWFQEAEDITGIDWRLIAAVGYQESQWDPLATSPTGVRGLMMLTVETAERMKVDDRLDPHQSILAGARYLLLLKDSLPPRIPEPDRTWLAIAAYNVGLGHLEDGRILAQRMNLNPDAWVNLKRSLPLLTRPEHFSTLKYGFARGGEAVIMTENVRTHYDILARFQPRRRPLFPSEPEHVSISAEDYPER